MNGLRTWLAAACCIAALAGFQGGSLADGDESSFVGLDRMAMRQLADPATYAGPTILALWSMDCVFCRKKLAGFAALKQTEPRLEIHTLLVENALPEHARILDAMGVPGVRYAYGGDSPEALAHALDPAWRGELPRTLLFDGRGGRIALSGMIEDERVLELVGLRRLENGEQR